MKVIAQYSLQNYQEWSSGSKREVIEIINTVVLRKALEKVFILLISKTKICE